MTLRASPAPLLLLFVNRDVVHLPSSGTRTCRGDGSRLSVGRHDRRLTGGHFAGLLSDRANGVGIDARARNRVGVGIVPDDRTVLAVVVGRDLPMSRPTIRERLVDDDFRPLAGGLDGASGAPRRGARDVL